MARFLAFSASTRSASKTTLEDMHTRLLLDVLFDESRDDVVVKASVGAKQRNPRKTSAIDIIWLLKPCRCILLLIIIVSAIAYYCFWSKDAINDDVNANEEQSVMAEGES